MSKYALVTVQDREITITIKDTLKEAQDKMLEELKECPDWEDWKENFKIGDETEEYFIGQTLGYANADDGDMNIDWNIFKITNDVILVKCVDRDISIIQFDSENEAYKQMSKEFSKLCEEEDFDDEDSDEYNINEYSAYLNAHSNWSYSYDWKIFKIE